MTRAMRTSELKRRRGEQGLLDARRKLEVVVQRCLRAPQPVLGLAARGHIRLNPDEVGDHA